MEEGTGRNDDSGNSTYNGRDDPDGCVPVEDLPGIQRQPLPPTLPSNSARIRRFSTSAFRMETALLISSSVLSLPRLNLTVPTASASGWTGVVAL